MTTLRWGGATDVGLIRDINQDRFACEFPVFVVADGMGGHRGGEVASQIAVDSVVEAFKSEPSADGLKTAVTTANQAIYEQSQADPELQGMGTTVTAIALVPWGDTEVFAVANVGDSRTYVMRLGELEQITSDHNVTEEMVRMGLLAPEDAETHEKRNMLTRALGIDDNVQVDTFEVTPFKGERYLLCSDGLVREVSDGQIAAVLRRIAEPEEAAHELVTMALTAGGSDNVTVVIVDVVDDGGRGDKAAKAAPLPEMKTYGSDERYDAEESLHEERPVRPSPKSSKPSRSNEDTRRPIFTIRLALFLFAFIAIVLGGLFAVRWYATNGYIVTTDDQDEIIIQEGRIGGVLWWQPVTIDETGYSLNDIRVENREQIEDGRQVSSLDEAEQLVSDLVAAGATRQSQSTTTGPTATSLTSTTVLTLEP